MVARRRRGSKGERGARIKLLLSYGACINRQSLFGVARVRKKEMIKMTGVVKAGIKRVSAAPGGATTK